MFKLGYLGEHEINEWLKYCYSEDEDNPYSVQKLTDLLNNKIVLAKLIDKNPGQEFPFSIDDFRKYLFKMYVERGDSMDKELYDLGSTISKQFNIDPVHTSGFLLNTHDVRKHLKKCLCISQNARNERELIDSSFKKSVEFAKEILNNVLERARKEGKVEPDEVLCIDIVKEDGSRISIEDLYDISDSEGKKT